MKARINGTTIFFDIEGPGLVPEGEGMVTRTPCFLLHGGPGSDHSYWKPWISALTDVIMPIYIDHRGNGRSARGEPKSYTLAQQAADLEALRLHLGLDRVMVMGISYGGMVALSYAVRYPESLSHLVAIATAPSYTWFEEGRRTMTDWVTKHGDDEARSLNAKLWEGRLESEEELSRFKTLLAPLYHTHGSHIDPEELRARVALNVPSYQALNYAFAHEIRTQAGYDLRAELTKITAPTLILGARHDWAMHPHQQEFMAAQIPNATLEWFETGHDIPADDREAFFGSVRTFLVNTSHEAS